MDPRTNLYLIRVGLGFVAALICVLYSVATGFAFNINDFLTAISFALLIYLVSYYFLKPHFEGKIKKVSKIFSTGVGIYFFIWIVFWTLFTTFPLQLPKAEFTFSPQQPFAGTTITFNASMSNDPDGSIVEYRWDFGDGNTSNTVENSTLHVYGAPGNYTVTLIVIGNDGGSDVETAEINVQPSPIQKLLKNKIRL